MKSFNYCFVDTPQAHHERRKKIIKAHPEIKNLMGTNPQTFFFIILISFVQFGAAFLLLDAKWWEILVFSYLFGAFASHALFVLYHECTHDLVFKSATVNKLISVFIDCAIGIPSSMGFRKYHLLHHTHLGDPLLDPDVVSKSEAELIGNSPLKKATWLMFFSVSQMMRPNKNKKVEFWDFWIIFNLGLVFSVELVLLYFFGLKFVAYLILSTFFALGLHPVGGRWIQEHYTTKKDQETYSYYGPLNRVAFNMGYHNEHHDFQTIPWNKLPKLKSLAPEMYDSLKSYNSWVAVVLQWIYDPNLSAFSRIVRDEKSFKKNHTALQNRDLRVSPRNLAVSFDDGLAPMMSSVAVSSITRNSVDLDPMET